MSSADLLLHPLRLRIVQAFLGDRQLTTGELLAEIDGVPAATLYRQVATLAKAGVLVVVGERQVRGTVERTYALSVQDAQVTDEDLREMSPDDHRRAFMAFLAGLLADVDRYVDTGDVDLERDGAGYRTVGLWLTRDELAAMVAEIGAVVQARAAQRAGARTHPADAEYRPASRFRRNLTRSSGICRLGVRYRRSCVEPDAVRPMVRIRRRSRHHQEMPAWLGLILLVLPVFIVAVFGTRQVRETERRPDDHHGSRRLAEGSRRGRRRADLAPQEAHAGRDGAAGSPAHDHVPIHRRTGDHLHLPDPCRRPAAHRRTGGRLSRSRRPDPGVHRARIVEEHRHPVGHRVEGADRHHLVPGTADAR